MERRQLSLSNYDEVLAEIERLERTGYKRAGQWSLGQVCRHLSYYMRGALEGYPFMLPWLIRKLLGRRLLRRALERRELPAGGRTIPASVPPAAVDEQACIAEAKALLLRLRDHRGPVHPSPLFGQLSYEEAPQLHLMHAAHHLSFLVPNSAQSVVDPVRG